MREAWLLWLLSLLTSASTTVIRRGWVTETPVPLSSAPAPSLVPEPTASLNATTPATNASLDDEDYYSAYPDYADFSLNTTDNSEKGPELVLPDDSLADTDLHDHDLIDSVMYIYFGGGQRQEAPPARQVVIVGAVIGLVAQLLTLIGGLRRVRSGDPSVLIIINAELALSLSSLVFMLGVQATSDRRHCEMVAITLHYLHLVASSWFSANCLYLYRKLRGLAPRLPLYFLAAWGLPAAIVYVCGLVEEPGYEFRDYCWMSAERGMLFSFMAPLSILMIVNTGLSVGGLRLATKAEEGDPKSLRVAASLLPLFAVSWFLGVIALENSGSLIFPLLFLVSHAFLNWYMLLCWLPGESGSWKECGDDEEDDEEELMYEEVKPGLLDLDQPLLYHQDELQMDPICTISS